MFGLTTARLIAYAVAGAALLAGVAWAVHDVRSAYAARRALPIARAELAQARADITAVKTDAERARRISDGYQTDLARVRADLRARPLGVVRVYRKACPPVPPAVGTVGGPDAPAPGPVAGPPAGDPGPDIGPALQDYAEDAATCAAQLTALQRWVRERP
jgi:hypothetical protein